MAGNRTIEPPPWQPPSWKPGDEIAALETLRDYAERYARAAIEWYYAKKPLKAWLSRILRSLTIVATAVGGLIPLVSWLAGNNAGSATEKALSSLRMNQFGYLSLGLAALFLALDRFFGSSTAWMRFIATAAAIETARESFRFDWARLTAGLGGRTPTDAELQGLITRMSQFSATVRALVESETKAWITEFQTNLAELERKTDAAVQTAREQAKQAREQAVSLQKEAAPGAIDLTVANAGDTDAGYTVMVGNDVRKTGVAGSTCGIAGIAPGLYEVTVSAAIGGIAASASQVVTVKPAEAARVSLTLAKAKSAASH